MLATAGLNIYHGVYGGYTNGTLSKIFLTIIALAYLKHYDEFILSHKKMGVKTPILYIVTCCDK